MQNPRIYGNPPYTAALVHGGPGAAGEMAPVALELSSEFGILEPLQTATSLSGQVAELAAQLKSVAELPVTLVGFSWGAWLSALVTAQHPHMVRKLILVGSGPFKEKYLPHIQATRLSRLSALDKTEYLAILAHLEEPDAEDKAVHFARLGELATITDQYEPRPKTDPQPEPISQKPQTGPGNPFHQVLRQAQALRKRGELLEIAAGIQCPVVALHGTYDPHPIAGVQQPLSSRLKDFRLVSFEKCGHKPWIEVHARARFYQVLRAELHAG